MTFNFDSCEKEPAVKRRRVESELSSDSETDSEIAVSKPSRISPKHCGLKTNVIPPPSPSERTHSITSLRRSITPPPGRIKAQTRSVPTNHAHSTEPKSADGNNDGVGAGETRTIPSPFQLTYIRDLGQSSNVDTIKLGDILGEPLIKECWQFNYLFDIDFLMSNFDEDVRELVQVRVVHGSWKEEDPHRVSIEEAAKRYPNVKSITAYMPEPFGTHHSKMMILIRHDGFAQVIIHTANMIPADWTNMCQAVWKSPLLPLQMSTKVLDKQSLDLSTQDPLGSGARFKADLLAYLSAYGRSKTGSLTNQLKSYDFDSIKAGLVASVPCKQNVSFNDQDNTMWGWLGLRKVLRTIHCKRPIHSASGHIVVQVSSIASLGQTDKWLSNTFFNALISTSSPKILAKEPKYSVVFPTADEIRRSLDGYQSGTSIHMKIQSAAQAKQVAYMKPMFCHWAGDGAQHIATQSSADIQIREAGRRRAAPHIKTYIRFTDSTMTSIEWAMVTSANLSTQAWGAAANASGEVRICSWEIGVVVWPDLWAGDGDSGNVEMIPVFKEDTPSATSPIRASSDGPSTAAQIEKRSIVGFRMPYDLPLVPYSDDDMPWCATSSYAEQDWMGRTYGGY